MTLILSFINAFPNSKLYQTQVSACFTWTTGVFKIYEHVVKVVQNPNGKEKIVGNELIESCQTKG